MRTDCLWAEALGLRLVEGREPGLQAWESRLLGWEQQLRRPWGSVREAAVLGEQVKRILIPLAGFDLRFKRVSLL